MYLTDTKKFPITFTSGINPNEGDEGNPDAYKKNKILMNRVAAFSEDKEISFSMGSRRADYDVINNPYKIMYRDEDSITSRAVDDFATVRLYTSGSYQKKDSFWDIQKPAPNTNPNKKKYKKNKHFYIDPFELTIAQWCYVMNWNNSDIRSTNPNTAKAAAINYLYSVSPSQLNEMAKSYWKYLMVWEHDTFASYKSGNSRYKDGTDEEYLEALYADADTMTGGTTYRAAAAYNPLQDTRPYYYATYNKVRGST